MGNGPTVELTIQHGGRTESYVVKAANHTPGEMIGALATVTGAAFGAHRVELRTVQDLIVRVLGLLGVELPRTADAAAFAATRAMVVDLLGVIDSDRLHHIIDAARAWPETGGREVGLRQLHDRATRHGAFLLVPTDDRDPIRNRPHTVDECNVASCPWHTPAAWYRGHRSGQACTDMGCTQTPHYAFDEPPF